MKRWNVKTIFFFSIDDVRRDINLTPEELNVVTGASGTGKSALIKTLDYCLGSSKCELPAYVRRRCIAVGVKWVAGEQEMIVGRIVPPVGQQTSTQMFVTAGHSLSIPTVTNEFQGVTTVDVAKSFLEKAFGIGDIRDTSEDWGKTRGRATIRHLPPYLFVTKEVIYSETVLLHGLDDKDKASDIIDSMPYFLRAETEATALAERRLRKLSKSLEIAEAKERARRSTESELKQRARSLLIEASQFGLVSVPSQESTETDLLSILENLPKLGSAQINYVDGSQLLVHYEERRKILSAINDVKRESRAADIAISESLGFRGAVSRQYQKLKFADYLKLDQIEHKCPLCDSATEKGNSVVQELKATIEKIRDESAAIERVQPKLQEHSENLRLKISNFNIQLKDIDNHIRALLKATDDYQRLKDLSEVRAHFLGRVSFFIDTTHDARIVSGVDLSVLRSEIEELERSLDLDAKKVKLRHAENLVSRFASEIFDVLPKVAPCNNAELSFSSTKPEVTMIEKDGSGSILRMPDIGSDQNYLAVHIALSFALQRYFKVVQSPVPGLLVLDQVSRPYFPAREGTDETLVSGEDEDVVAMRKHIDFLFSEVARKDGLQILLIEHAYFADDPRYVAATKERWTRSSGLALIPLDWPERSDKK
jgi:energy-coupling factor transporter ATP-binding protein EcfA2